jgi:hypothetical protein
MEMIVGFRLRMTLRLWLYFDAEVMPFVAAVDWIMEGLEGV